MLITALLSLFAGMLSVFAPCILPLLPVIVGGSLDSSDSNKRRPYIITASLVVSLISFTILLKISTAFIGISPSVWAILSGILIITLGVFMLVPDLWTRIIGAVGLEHRTQKLLNKTYAEKNKTWSAILTGAALGPVFSSCSPMYAWVVASVLPASTGTAILYLAMYCLGVAIALLSIALIGRKLLVKVRWATDPKGWFQRGIAIVFIIVGVGIAFGWDKDIQTYLVEKDVFNYSEIQMRLVPEDN